ncbi:MAG: hypothetical protein M1816_000537 [Peltula sp. TS41687]|nr:MAG: hypothetical protein M1816_000537 [Peltula sp. TS41687]
MADQPSTSLDSPGVQSSTTSPTVNTANVQNVSVGGDIVPCQWRGCNARFTEPQKLYDHLTNDHIGRKVTSNLNLTCAWGDCKNTSVKRDHITSHVRIHVHFKPHECRLCRKKFKRPQDLKKHVKTHADDSVLSRVPDPFGAPRMRGQGSYNGARNAMTNDLQSLAATATGYYDHQPGPGGHQAFGPQNHHAPYYGAHHQYGPDWSPYAQGGAGSGHHAASLEGRKRGHDVLNDFFGAVKRREINPASYGEVSNSLMALHGVELPVLGSTPMFQSASPMVAGGHEGPMGRQPHAMPHFPNLRTKNDLLHIDGFLDQVQSAQYDNHHHRAAAAGTGANLAAAAASAIPKSSHSGQSGTPALTPPSSTSQRSGYSPASVGSDSVSVHGTSPVPPSSAASIYPNLPMVHSHGDSPSGYSGPGSTPTSTIESAFHTDHRQRYSGQMLHRAARPSYDGSADEVDEVDVPVKDKGIELLIDPALKALSAPVPVPVASKEPSTKDDKDDKDKDMNRDTDKVIRLSVQDLYIIQWLQEFLRMSLVAHHFVDEDDDAADTSEESMYGPSKLMIASGLNSIHDVKTMLAERESSTSASSAHASPVQGADTDAAHMTELEKDAQHLYPVLRALQDAR